VPAQFGPAPVPGHAIHKPSGKKYKGLRRNK